MLIDCSSAAPIKTAACRPIQAKIGNNKIPKQAILHRSPEIAGRRSSEDGQSNPGRSLLSSTSDSIMAFGFLSGELELDWLSG